jgi:hypothetical protein
VVVVVVAAEEAAEPPFLSLSLSPSVLFFFNSLYVIVIPQYHSL